MKATFKNGELTIGDNTIKLRDVIDSNYNELGVGEDVTYDGKCSYKLWVTGGYGWYDEKNNAVEGSEALILNIRVRDIKNKKIYKDYFPLNMHHVKRIYNGNAIHYSSENKDELFRCACEISKHIEFHNLILDQIDFYVKMLKKNCINYSNIQTIDEIILSSLKLKQINYSSIEDIKESLNSIQSLMAI